MHICNLGEAQHTMFLLSGQRLTRRWCRCSAGCAEGQFSGARGIGSTAVLLGELGRIRRVGGHFVGRRMLIPGTLDGGVEEVCWEERERAKVVKSCGSWGARCKSALLADLMDRRGKCRSALVNSLSVGVRIAVQESRGAADLWMKMR